MADARASAIDTPSSALAPSRPLVDVRHRFGDTLAEVARLVAVAKLERFALTRRRARRHGRAADDAGIERHFGFDCWISARVDDLAPFDLCDGVHADGCLYSV